MHHRHMQQRSSTRVLQLAPPQKAVSCVNPEVEPKNSPRSWCEIKTEIHGPSATPRTIPSNFQLINRVGHGARSATLAPGGIPGSEPHEGLSFVHATGQDSGREGRILIFLDP